MTLRFGDCTFDAEARELRRGDVPVELTPKAFQLLGLLLERRPNGVSKAEIRDQLWPRTFVADVNLATLAFEVRTAIGDRARGARFLRTLRGYGYAFVGEVEERGIPRPIRFRLVFASKEVGLCDGEHVLGRSTTASIVLEAGKISRQHARIRVAGDTATLEDLGSKNGTYCRGRLVTGQMPLEDGDEIEIGRMRLVFRRALPDDSTETSGE